MDAQRRQVEIERISPPIALPTTWPRDRRTLAGSVRSFGSNPVPVSSHIARQHAVAVRQLPTQRCSREGRGVVCCATTGTRHPTKLVLGIANGLSVQSVEAFPRIVVCDTRYVRRERLLLLDRNPVYCPTDVAKWGVSTALEPCRVRQPTRGAAQLEVQV